MATAKIPFSKKHGPRFKTGAKPSPKSAIFAALSHVPIVAPPAQFAIVPKQLDIWGNDTYGDCVTAEEAFAKACYEPEIFIQESEVIRWARAHGVLNGASLTEVLDGMKAKGFQAPGQLYNDGSYSSVDYNEETTLRSAISQGPVKIAIPASCLPSGAGSVQGWYTTSSRTGRTDHCVALSGYGPAAWLYQQLGVQLPSALPADTQGYLLFTWATIGFVTFKWIKAAVDEAWLRNPTTIGVPPLAPPVPPTPPGPPVAPPLLGSFIVDTTGPIPKVRGTATLTISQPWSGSADYKIVPAPGGQFVFEPKLPS